MDLKIVLLVATLLIVFLILLIYFMFKIRNKKTKKPVINKKDIVKYLLKNYSNINFDVSKLDVFEFEDIETQKTFIIEDLVIQFATTNITFPNNAPMIEHESLWDSYQVNSKPLKGKVPIDLSKRRNSLIFRDKHTCQRCSFDISSENMRIYFLRSIEDGGDYSFENMLSVCNDCHKVLHSDDIKKIIHNLDLTEKLYSII